VRPGRLALPAVVVAACGVGFGLLSLWPWRHLVGPAYLLRFAAFAAALGLLAGAAGVRLGGQGAARRGLATLAASLAVFGSVWLWNDNGEIDVILLHLDSFRADHASFMGYPRETTPRLQALADEGAVLFERFFAQSAGTDKSTPAMLAGIYPSMFYDPARDADNFALPDRFPLLGELLGPAGWSCWALSSNPKISEATNYARGFDDLDEQWVGAPRAHELVTRMRARIDGASARRYFYFGLVLDPHVPYEPVPDFNLWAPHVSLDQSDLELAVAEEGLQREELIARLVDLYDGEIREVDDACGALVEWLRQSGRWERTMFIVTSDHGDNFFEHGALGHGSPLWDDVVHVPMLWHFPSPLRFPALRPSGDVYEGLASHVDIVPTVLGFLGLPADAPHLRGRDLVPALYGRAEPPEHAVFAEELIEGSAIRMLRTREWKLMTIAAEGQPEQVQLFDLLDDPDELRPLGPEDADADRLAEMWAELERRRAEAAAFYVRPEPVRPDPEAQERLEELGYVR
jgi:arylsulfatase A-like enzyme